MRTTIESAPVASSDTRLLRILFSYEGGLPIDGYGGGHQIARGFARTLGQLGHDVHVVLGGADEVGAGREDGLVTYHAMNAPATQRFFRSGQGMLAQIRALRPDVVCSFTPELGLVAPACVVLRVPLLTYLADPELLQLGISLAGLRNARRHWGQVFQRLGCEACARVTTISEHTSRQAREIWKLPPERVTTVGTGLHDAYLASPARPLERAAGSALRVLSVGRVALAQKPLDLVADALAGSPVPWSHWTIVGGGSDRQPLGERLERLGIASRVRMVGFMTPPQVVSELECHDLVILPSRYESFFMTPYEAVVRQRMVVTNDVAEVKQRLGRSPLLVLARDASSAAYVEALAAAWQRLEAGPVSDGETADAIRRDLSWQRITSNLLAVMYDAVGRRSQRPWPHR